VAVAILAAIAITANAARHASVARWKEGKPVGMPPASARTASVARLASAARMAGRLAETPTALVRTANAEQPAAASEIYIRTYCTGVQHIRLIMLNIFEYLCKSLKMQHK